MRGSLPFHFYLDLFQSCYLLIVTFFELKEWEKNRILNSQKQTSYKNRLSEMPGNKEESMKLINVFEKYEKEAGDYFE